MLLKVRPGLTKSKVFDGLNRFLREIVLASLENREINQAAMPNGLIDAVLDNELSHECVIELRNALAALNPGSKAALRNELLLDVQPCSFLTDHALSLPVVPQAIFAALKKLSVHLYQRTGKLVGVEASCGERIADHYARFRAVDPPGSGNVCCVCGTDYLVQLRSDLNDNEQWRGPYDHILAKDRYPLYGVHPLNLIPICHTCNSKAKLTQDVLHHGANRRLSFSPWSEQAASAEIRVKVDTSDPFPRVVVTLESGDPVRQEKLDTWNDVYQITERIQGEFLALREKVAEEVDAADDATFVVSLEARANARANACRRTPFNYWRARVYRAIRDMDAGSREAFRDALQQSIPPANEMDDLFFN